jgi:hypothetical protein
LVKWISAPSTDSEKCPLITQLFSKSMNLCIPLTLVIYKYQSRMTFHELESWCLCRFKNQRIISRFIRYKCFLTFIKLMYLSSIIYLSISLQIWSTILFNFFNISTNKSKDFLKYLVDILMYRLIKNFPSWQKFKEITEFLKSR